ncbi:Lmo0850 family protein [Peribacillus acanthi]|uniref:Lmo0850 family protein n=1 Tax=Peribacillus acanthi TaxID=2171554 RepID=UPI000D3E2754|nr:Lmo0850 family protein [Peribacillus acanthi]
MVSDIISKFQNKGIKIEKTKSRREVFQRVFQTDPAQVVSKINEACSNKLGSNTINLSKV